MSIKWNFTKHFVASLFIAFVSFISNIILGFLSQKTIDNILNNDNVAIIGGADGPTSIYVSNSGLIGWLPFPSYAIFLVLLLALYVPLKVVVKRKKKQL